MTWLDEIQNNQEKLVKTWPIQPGDFVNLDTWFGDFWAEVAEVHDTGPFIVIYREDHGILKTDWILLHSIYKICKSENRNRIDTCNIITKNGKISATYPMNPGAYNFIGDYHR